MFEYIEHFWDTLVAYIASEDMKYIRINTNLSVYPILWLFYMVPIPYTNAMSVSILSIDAMPREHVNIMLFLYLVSLIIATVL